MGTVNCDLSRGGGGARGGGERGKGYYTDGIFLIIPCNLFESLIITYQGRHGHDLWSPV